MAVYSYAYSIQWLAVNDDSSFIEYGKTTYTKKGTMMQHATDTAASNHQNPQAV